MTDRRALMRILAGATLFCVARRARAQKTKSFTVTYLALLPGEDRNFVPNFLRRLDQLGYVDGQNLHFVYRSVEGRPELLPDLASDLIRMKPDVIVTGFGTVAAKAAGQPEMASRSYLWPSVIPSAPGSLPVSPGPVAMSLDCRT